VPAPSAALRDDEVSVPRAAVLPAPLPVPIAAAFDNAGIASGPAGGVGFDGHGRTFRVADLRRGRVVYAGVPYEFAPAAGRGNDNLVARGQRLVLPRGRYTRGYVLAAAPLGFAGRLGIAYADGTVGSARISVAKWTEENINAVVQTPRINGRPGDPPAVNGYIEALPVPFDQTRTATALELPAAVPGGAALHVFALTLVPRIPPRRGAALAVIAARSTTRHGSGPGRPQLVDVTVANIGNVWITQRSRAAVAISAPHVRTLTPALITSLAPGERLRVEVPIAAAHALRPGTPVAARAVVSLAGGATNALPFVLHAGIPAYTAANVRTHEPPDWFDAAKFGIFITWGVYSVPAFARVGDYAEWYWQWIHDPTNVARAHQLATYGPRSHYDDFIPRFRAERFDPKDWVQLFTRAGARYFVLVSKHHDGFTLFGTRTTNRNAVALGPHRDIARDLFAAARRYAPQLHRSMYYSLYEWYNPAYTKRPVPGWFDGRPVPYTGFKPVRSYVDDVMLPQLHEIIDNEKPDILWCDGAWDKSWTYWHDAATFADYFNAAESRGQDVTINDRCRANSDARDGHDFYTPEYATFATTIERKWEANSGMGYSFSYNAAEQPADYKSATALIASLVDIVSKNGNLLLDIGPKADGTIPSIMRDRLLTIGAWLRVNGEAIYGTTYWWQTSEDGDLRFTLRPNGAFYIISLARPAAHVVVHPAVPIAAGDTIALLGWPGGVLHWSHERGYLVIDVPPAARAAGAHAWTFRITHHAQAVDTTTG
jgi:alpha-L-fucosidase